jgi:hypothetical protein
MKPRKAQVKDKGLWAKSWDFGDLVIDICRLSFLGLVDLGNGKRICSARILWPIKVLNLCEYCFVHLALLVDGDETITNWQFHALQKVLLAGHTIDLILIANGTGYAGKKRLDHAAYYLFAIINRFKMKPIARTGISSLGTDSAKKIRFDRKYKGAWEFIPDEVLTNLKDIDVVIKFGMGLLADTEKITTEFGILSYHHGDPSKYRGRPAGFWECLNSERIMGVIVQQISNTLDGGAIKAIGYSRVEKTSYRKTLSNVYETSIPLLLKAIENCDSNIVISSELSRETYRLPRNRVVTKLVFKQSKSLLQKLIYGAFVQKKWSVAQVDRILNLEDDTILDSKEMSRLPVPKGYIFSADAVGILNNRIYCELLDRKSGFGEIGIWDGANWEILETGIQGHKSYPQIVSNDGKNYLFPEVSSTNSPVLIEIDSSGFPTTNRVYLGNQQDSRHVDGTLFKINNYWYLFSGNREKSHQQLDLYYSDNLFGEFYLHPKSPISLDPRNSRMAGPIFEYSGRIYRFSQDCSEKYGSRININRINQISISEYQENLVGSLQIEDAIGPHSLLVEGGKIWIDLYKESFDIKAGLRRLKSKI